MKVFTCTLAAMLAMAWSSSSAVALDITFDDVTSVGNPLVTELETRAIASRAPSGPSTRPAGAS